MTAQCPCGTTLATMDQCICDEFDAAWEAAGAWKRFKMLLPVLIFLTVIGGVACAFLWMLNQ